MAGLVREPVRVVIINTKYVETDVRSFKSVVQEFTGKDSAPPGNSDHEHLKRGLSRKLTSKDEIRAKRVRLDASDKVSYAGGDQVLMRDLSFKEMPSMDELYRSWADI
ncbi:VQ motif-containing protein 1-like [Populus alba x Populus x berolinensis]|nr:VQ motif-containing protein 1-like [Populus alba x Populus x berolinensis]